METSTSFTEKTLHNFQVFRKRVIFLKMGKIAKNEDSDPDYDPGPRLRKQFDEFRNNKVRQGIQICNIVNKF